ncbi:hypothetical protein SAMN02745163_00244 [Clostridium cavendishii DSM 21758]|uniref:Flagellar protein FliT n=1 Tax=Clostridium cavendishii DSM 21758 TaxID=1121302 RepID=A0A1M6B3J0_9CLOT|nr:hypothetical protein [Clostridium cavendishii]SHI43178.1 hypothetical protein SAMN02745163_00244 [Clostridium cavendishii DSM 21758]
MDNLLEELLIEYRNISLKLIEDLNQDKYEFLEQGLERKDAIQQEIDGLNFSKDKFIELSKNLELETINNKLYEITMIKRNEAKDELTKINKTRQMRNNYNTANKTISFFNAEI